MMCKVVTQSFEALEVFAAVLEREREEGGKEREGGGDGGREKGRVEGKREEEREKREKGERRSKGGRRGRSGEEEREMRSGGGRGREERK